MKAIIHTNTRFDGFCVSPWDDAEGCFNDAVFGKYGAVFESLEDAEMWCDEEKIEIIGGKE